MGNGGKRFTASAPAGGNPTKPRWKDDPERPGIQRYWTGEGWADDIPPRAKPDTTWKQARVIALAIAIVAAGIFTLWRIQQPSEAECRTQAVEVLRGQRLSVDSGCRGRF